MQERSCFFQPETGVGAWTRAAGRNVQLLDCYTVRLEDYLTIITDLLLTVLDGSKVTAS
jgi:hypothetical protein